MGFLDLTYYIILLNHHDGKQYYYAEDHTHSGTKTGKDLLVFTDLEKAEKEVERLSNLHNRTYVVDTL